MKILDLEIQDYRGVSFHQDFTKLGNVIILSGKNGTGKTTILESINILLGRSISSLNQDEAKAITNDKCTLSISIYVTDEEIKQIFASIKSFLNDNRTQRIDFDELKNKCFQKNIFRRKLNIKRYEDHWQASRMVDEEIHSTNSSSDFWSSGIESNFFQTLCRFFARVENINAGEIILLNTQMEYAQITTNQQDGGSRQHKTNVQLSDLVSIPINKAILDSDKEKVKLQIKEVASYLGSAFDGGNVQFDEEHFDETGRIILQLSYGKDIFPISQASSGQRQALSLLSLIKNWSSSVSKPVLILDEPDLGMHPTMIRKVTAVLKKELIGVDATCIIATHSADLIKSYAENIFRLTKEDSGKVNIEKVEGLAERVQLLSDIGADFDIDYLVPKIIFVESVEKRSPKGGLPDEEIYQQLVDPTKRAVLFKSGIKDQGSAEWLKERKDAWNAVISAITGQDSNVYTLRDRDGGSYSLEARKDLNTPYRNVEYFYILFPDLISKVLKNKFNVKLGSDDIVSYFRGRDDKYNTSLFDVDCKIMWQAFLEKLRQEHSFDEKDTSSLESAIINGFAESRHNFNDDIKRFFEFLRQ